MTEKEIEAQADEVVRGVLGTMALEGANLGSEAAARLKQYMINHIKQSLEQREASHEPTSDENK